MPIGVLGLQGDFEAHRNILNALGVGTIVVKKSADLAGLHGLVMPGGESTTLLKLMSEDFKAGLADFVAKGNALLTTCAGTIIIADTVSNPAQESLKLLDIAVERNSYGRQVDSFITTELVAGRHSNDNFTIPPEAVFVRAPRILSMGPEVQVLCTHNSDPVLVQKDKILAATFHPELSPNNSQVHELFVSLAGIS